MQKRQRTKNYVVTACGRVWYAADASNNDADVRHSKCYDAGGLRNALYASFPATADDVTTDAANDADARNPECSDARRHRNALYASFPATTDDVAADADGSGNSHDPHGTRHCRISAGSRDEPNGDESDGHESADNSNDESSNGNGNPGPDGGFAGVRRSQR